MARPPVEWPIPVYVAELRERTIMACRVPAAALAGRVQPPLFPLVSRGQAIVGVAFGSGRCLKSACGSRHLAGEFTLTEVLTPVLWHPACRPAVRGNWLLAGSCSAAGVRRLCRASLGVDLRERVSGVETCAVSLERPVREAPWPAASCFASPEAAETLLLHPECYFVPGDGKAIVRAAPVHQYARSTVPVDPCAWDLAAVAALLGLPEAAVVVDHAFYQKRCTHTWAFPAERIPLTQFFAQRPHADDYERLARAA